MFDGVPAHVNLVEVRECLQAMAGVAQVNDLHVWAMGTSEVALTAHLVMPDGPADDDFLRAGRPDAAGALRHRPHHAAVGAPAAGGGLRRGVMWFLPRFRGWAVE